MSKFNGLFSSNSDVWSTPDDLFNSLNAEFDFNLDPCALPFNAKCSNFFTPDQNGLLQDWAGHRVFCNPPYSDISLWVEKCFRESRNDYTLIVLLIPSRTDTKYFHNFIYNRCEIRFVRGRLRFGSSFKNAPFPSMICIFRGAYC